MKVKVWVIWGRGSGLDPVYGVYSTEEAARAAADSIEADEDFFGEVGYDAWDLDAEPSWGERRNSEGG